MAGVSTGLKLFAEGGLYTFGLFLLRAGNFLLLPLFLKYLEPQEYGAFGVMKQAAMVLALLAISGQGQSILRLGLDAEWDEDQLRRLVSTVYTWVLLAACSLAGIAALLWPWLGGLLDGMPLWPVGAAGLAAVAGLALFQLTLAWLQFNHRAKEHTALNLIRWGVQLILIFVFLIGLELGATGLLLAMALSYLVGSLIGLRTLPRGCRPQLHLPSLSSSLRYGIPLLPLSLSGVIFAATDQVLLAAHPDHGLNAAGIYLLAFQLGSAVTMFAVGMQKAWIPFFFRQDKAQAEEPDWSRVRLLSFFSVSVVACAAVGVGLLAPEVITLAAWFGSGDYQAAAAIVPILTFGAVIRAYYLLSASVILADKKISRWIALTTLPAAALNIFLNAWWIPEHGLFGAASATVISHAVAMLGTGLLARRARKIPFKYRRALLLLVMVAGTLYFAADRDLGVRLLAILGFGASLLVLDGRDIFAAVRSLVRQRGGKQAQKQVSPEL
jgi:O-antigen/teichoic acid export membrane protein